MAIDLIMRIAGEGGEGVISTGDFLMQAATRSGMEVVTFKTFPSEIKGGYALSQVRISDEPILSQGDTFQVLVAFNGEAYEIDKENLLPGTAIVYDGPEGGDFEAEEHEGVYMYPVPMTKLSKEIKSPISKNMVALGAVAELFGVPMESIKSSVHDKFIRKGQEVVDKNFEALDAGVNYVKENHKKTDPFVFPAPAEQKDVIIVEGNEAVALGAMAAGCEFFSCYPITPATTVANYIAEMMLKKNCFMFQAEDEIASIGNVIGGSFAGKKSMTSTSGPGMDLMSELIGLASMAEIPLVIVNVQRGGPSTGMPTKHDQSDFLCSAFGSHGDTPKIVLAASNVEDNFYLTVDAFNMSEKYQMPVIMLTDASLAIRTEAIPTPDISKLEIIERESAKPAADSEEAFLRYLDTPSGVSAMGAPGIPGTEYAATGLEHAENSGPRTSPHIKVQMTEKRWRKIKDVEADYKPAERDGVDDADIGIVSWGLTQSMVREAMERLKAKGHSVAALYPKLVWPLPVNQLEEFGKSVKKIFIPEANYLGQMSMLVRSYTSLEPETLNLYKGEPFIPKEIEEAVEELLK